MGSFLAFGDKITLKVSIADTSDPIGIYKIFHLTKFNFEHHSSNNNKKVNNVVKDAQQFSSAILSRN